MSLSLSKNNKKKVLDVDIYGNGKVKDEKIYFDVQITNLVSSSTPPQAIYFNQNRNTPYLYSPSDYYMSIVRFFLSTETLPVFIPVIQPNQSDPTLTSYSVTLQVTLPITGGYSGTTYIQQTYLVWSPQDVSQPVPIPPSSTTNGLQVDSVYYYAYSFEYLPLLVLEAFSTCYNALFAQMTTADQAYFSSLNNGSTTTPYTSCQPPIFTYDTQNNTAVMYSQSVYYNNVIRNNPNMPNPNAIQVYMNTSLFTLFSSLPNKALGYAAANGTNFRIIIQDSTGSNNIYLPTTSTPALGATLQTITVQEYSTIQSWTPIESIVFTSNTIPIVANLISTPQVSNNNVLVSNSTANNTANIITDLISTDLNYRPYLLYNPTAQYRLIDMYSNTPLSNLDISVFYRNKVGNLIPITLTSGGSCSLKILFTKKQTERPKE